MNSEYVVNREERLSQQQTKKRSIDLVYTDYEGKRRFCFELKNIRVQDLEMGQNLTDQTHELKRKSDTLAMLDYEDALELALKPKEDCPGWFQHDWAPTVGQFMDKIVNEVKRKYQPELQKDDGVYGTSLAWVIVRVGLGKILHKRVF